MKDDVVELRVAPDGVKLEFVKSAIASGDDGGTGRLNAENRSRLVYFRCMHRDLTLNTD